MTHPLTHPDEGPPELDDATAAPAPDRWQARVRWAILVAGVVGLALVARDTVRRDGVDALPSPAAVAAAVLLFGGSAAAAGRAWVALLGPAARPAEARGALYLSQLGKYVPGGGLVQAAGQVTLSATADVPLRRVAVAWASSIVLAVVAGAVLSVGLVAVGDLAGPVRGAAVAGLLPLLALDRRCLAATLRVGRRLVRRVPDPALLPPQRALTVAAGWTLLNVAANAASFTVLLVELDGSRSPAAVLPAFAAAWVIGFVAAPLPAGLGVREAALVALLPGAGTGVVVAASLAQRACAVAAEVALAIGNALARRRRRPAA